MPRMKQKVSRKSESDDGPSHRPSKDHSKSSPRSSRSVSSSSSKSRHHTRRPYVQATPPSSRFSCHSGTPWMIQGKTYNTGVLGLHEEIEDFFNYMSPTPEEHNARLTVVNRIKGAIKRYWPQAIVEVFGSFRTGLYLPTSDIDMVVIGKWHVDTPIRTLESILTDRSIAKRGPTNLRVIDKAKVPIIKMIDAEFDVKVDISFNQGNGIRAAELIKKFRRTYPALPKLLLVLKQFLHERDLNEVYTGGIGSYSLIIMIVSFFQRNPRPDAGMSDANLGTLLMEFFELYGRHFNYSKTVICVEGDGSYMSKEEFRKVQKAQNDAGYKQNHRTSPICIMDPTTPGNDLGQNSHEFPTVRKSFEYAYTMLNQGILLDSNEKSLLGRIISVPDAVINYRKWIHESFPIQNS